MPDQPPIGDVLHFFKLTDAPLQEQQEFLDEVMESIFMRVGGRIKKDLAPEQQDEFTRLFRGNASQEERTAFLEQYAPQFEDMVIEEVMRFREQVVIEAQRAALS